MINYSIFYCGQLQPGADPDSVQAQLEKLFQAPAERIRSLMQSGPTPIKQNLNADQARRYQQVLEQAGLQVDIVPPLEGTADSPTEATAPAPQPEAEPERDATPPRDLYCAAFSHVKAPNFKVAPSGSDLQEPVSAAQPQPIDLSHFSLAPVGADIETLPQPVPPEAPNTDALKLVD